MRIRLQMLKPNKESEIVHFLEKKQKLLLYIFLIVDTILIEKVVSVLVHLDYSYQQGWCITNWFGFWRWREQRRIVYGSDNSLALAIL